MADVYITKSRFEVYIRHFIKYLLIMLKISLFLDYFLDRYSFTIIIKVINIKRLLLNKLTPKDVILISLLLIIVATSLELGFDLVWLQLVTVCLVAMIFDIGFNLAKKRNYFSLNLV